MGEQEYVQGFERRAQRPPDTIRVVLGDDSYLIRQGLTRTLEVADGIELVATSDDLESLREAVKRTKPDVVVTDIRMPPTYTDEGIRFAAELRQSHPEVGVVILSQHEDPTYALTLFADGSNRRAFLLKERLRDQAELLRALREVAAGGSLVDPRMIDKLLAGRLHRDPQLDKLSPRERETLAMIAEGLSNAAIAEKLTITRRAVERHINSIFSKLELSESDDINRRVKATLLYLADESD